MILYTFFVSYFYKREFWQKQFYRAVQIMQIFACKGADITGEMCFFREDRKNDGNNTQKYRKLFVINAENEKDKEKPLAIYVQ